MKVYISSIDAYSGTDYAELYPQARKLYNSIKGQTKRQPYVRSKFFDKEKVFIELFWVHLNQKNRKDRNERIKYYACGLDVVRNSMLAPVTKKNPNRSGELLHRFAGISPSKELFYVQIKEDTKTGRKDFMSVFPAN